MFRPPAHRPRTAATLVLVVLTLLAGCNASAIPGIGPSQPYETPLNASEVEAGHERALEDAGSATVRVETNLSVSGRATGAGNATVETEFDDGPTHVTANASGATTEVYVTENGSGYSRVAAGNVVRYDVVGGLNASSFTELDVGQVVERHDFTTNGTAEIDGETTYVYETTNASTGLSLPGQLAEHDVTIRLYVRGDGLVKRMALEVRAGEDTAFAMSQTYTDVGSTTVEEPSWLDEAMEATAES